MKIVWMHAHYLNWMGGHNFIYEVVKRLSKKHQIIMLSSVSSESARQKFSEIKVPLHDLSGKSTNNVQYWLQLPKYLNIEKKAAENYVKDADLIITSHFPYNYLAQEFQKTHIYCCWEPYALFHDQNYLKGFNLQQRAFIAFITMLYKKLDIIGTQQADKVLTLSEFNKKWIKDIYQRGDADITYEGVDTDFFNHKLDKDIAKQYQGNQLIMHSTDFTTIKGTEHLIKALPLVVKKFPNLKVLITHTLKSPEKKLAIQNLAKSLGVDQHLVFLGRVDYDLLPVYYSISNLVVQPSVNQSMNLSVKEAMACGTAVVTSPEGYEQTPDGEAGYLVDPFDTKKLAEAIIKILENPRLQKKMGKKGREIIMRKFTWDAVTAHYQKSISSLATAR